DVEPARQKICSPACADGAGADHCDALYGHGRSPPSQAVEEGTNLATGEIGFFVVHEMAGSRDRRHFCVAEILAEPIRPGALEDGIALAPQHARRQIYRHTLRLRCFVAHCREPSLVGADVPVEAALEIAGLEEIVDPGLDILVEGVGI